MGSIVSDITDAIGLTDVSGREEMAEEALAEQEKANDAAKAEADLANAKSRRQSVSQRRVKQAQVESSADSSGVGSSSAAIGAAGAIGSKKASAIGAANNTLSTANIQQISSQNIADLQNQISNQAAQDAMNMQVAMMVASAAAAPVPKTTAPVSTAVPMP